MQSAIFMPVRNSKTGFFKRLALCRICHSDQFFSFLDLGTLPLVNTFSKKPNDTSLSFPLKMLFCKNCGLIELDGVIDPNVLFSNYVYRSSLSKTFQSHCEELVTFVCNEFPQLTSSRVLDIGSNDGCLLQAFRQRGFQTVGVEPSKNLAKLAKQNKIETMVGYWDSKTAKQVLKKERVSIITATSVLSHVSDLHSFVQNCQAVLATNGVMIVEVHYAASLIEKKQFDTIAHENCSYFLLKPLLQLFEEHGFKAIDAQTDLIHADALRLVLVRKQNPVLVKPNIARVLAREEKNGLYRIQTYAKYQNAVEQNRKKILDFLNAQRKARKIVAGFAAAAKASLILNFFRIRSDLVVAVVDQTPQKQGLFIGGTDIPVVGMDWLHAQPTDFLIVFSWNYANEIMQKTRFFSEKGGRFVLLVPSFKILPRGKKA